MAAKKVAEASVDEVNDIPSSGEESTSDTTSEKPKKRKRDTTQASELEIDVSLPEPLSKKALRKSKKQKTAPADTTTENSVSQAASSDRAVYGIWVGNLPFTITKEHLLTFLTTNSEPKIENKAITRVHLPPPYNPGAGRGPAALKPQNRGFAYVDFADQASFMAAMALTESPLGGRRVLIKDAKNFEGRPAEHSSREALSRTAQSAAGTLPATNGPPPKKPSRRVFVGNLSFDVTKEDLSKHYATCGTIEDIHMATFEDSGKCKGFAWITFENEEAAQCAVQGWTKIRNKDDFPDDDGEDGAAGEDGEGEGEGDFIVTKDGQKKRKKKRMVKWFVNRMYGRELRCEFAEDSSTRYKKRFGKEGKTSADDSRNGVPAEQQDWAVEVNGTDRPQRKSFKPRGGYNNGISPGEGNDPNKRRVKKDNFAAGKVRGGAAEARYRTGAITEGTGQKITFD